MRVIFLAGWFLTALGQGNPDAPQKFTYRIFSGDRRVGTEKVEIEEEDGRLNIRSALTLRREVKGKTVETTYRGELRADPKTLRPERYDIQGEGPGKPARFRFEVEGGKIRLSGTVGGKSIPVREVERSAGAIFYDGLMVSHMAALLRVRAPKPGKRTRLRATVLPDLTEVELVVEDRGEANLIGPGRIETARSYFVKLETVGMIVYVDPKGRLVLFRNPFNNTRIALEGYEGFRVAAKAAPKLPAGADEKEIRFENGEVSLAGSLVVPEGGKKSKPAVLLLPGAGPVDRNGNTMDLRIDLLKVLAYRLAGAGFVVLRYDKRGIGRSEGDSSVTDLDTLIEDAGTAVRWLRGRKEVDRRSIVLVGHGEGAQIAALRAGKDPGIRGAVLLSAPAVPLDELLVLRFREEARRRKLGEERIEEEIRRRKKYFEKIRNAEEEWLEIREGERVYIGWLRDHFKLNLASRIREVRCAVAVLHGLRDRVVPPENADRLERALKDSEHPNFEVMRFEQLDHTFMQSEEGGIARLAEERPVDPGFLAYLLETVRRFAGR